MTRTIPTQAQLAKARARIEADAEPIYLDRALRAFDRAIPVIAGALEKGAVPNPVYKDARSDLANAYEEAAKVVYRDRPKDSHRLPAPLAKATNDMWPALHHVPGAIRRLEALQARHPDMGFLEGRLTLLRIFLPISEAVEAAKEFVVKRAPPSDDGPPAWAPPPASDVAQRAVYDALKVFTDEAHGEIVRMGTATYRGFVDRYMAAQTRAEPGTTFGPRFQEKVFGNAVGTGNAILAKVAFPRGNRFGAPLDLLPDWQDRIVAEATRDADDIRNRFVGKNRVKIASIVDGKGGIRSVEPGERHVDMRGLQGDVVVSFDDGSSFRARNAIVWSTSVHGTPYVRFPLTFHDVRLADGTTRSFMSEEEMNDVFLAAPEASEDEAPAPRGP